MNPKFLQALYGRYLENKVKRLDNSLDHFREIYAIYTLGFPSSADSGIRKMREKSRKEIIYLTERRDSLAIKLQSLSA